MAVNISARHFSAETLVRDVREALRESGLPPEQLVLELTETSLAEDPTRAEDQLAVLRGLGVRVAIDDFGTGWSSLHRLRRLPVGTLKLDRSFLTGVPEGAEASAVVRAILDLGAALGKLVVAEGVETQRQLDFLVGQGCPLVQGFLLGRPAPAEALRLSESRPWRSPSTTRD
jgi:EAL domain-containing protein (putative c-di-GMP-specific phosphodiesterase class I)